MTHECPVCGEAFTLSREVRHPAPRFWNLYVVHSHECDPPQWKASVFYREPRGRFSTPAKAIVAEQKESRKLRMARSKATPEQVRTCPLHPMGCEERHSEPDPRFPNGKGQW